MRALLVFEGGPGAILPLVPLAHALRGAGHEVIAAAHEDALPTLLEAGVPAVVAPRKSPKDYREQRAGKLVPISGDLDERAAVLGAIGARIAADTVHDLRDLVSHWRPDLIVGGPLAYAAPLLSAELHLPYVAVEFGFAEPLNWHQVTVAELARLGFGELPSPAATLLLCPESVRPADGAMRRLPGEPMRYLPYSSARPLEPWMVTKGDRPRVWISAGSRVGTDYGLDHLNGLIDSAARLDVELLIATPDHVAEHLGALPERARVGWLPFDVVAPTCDLALHHGGGSTMLGFAAHGIPQVMIPNVVEFEEYLVPIGATGAAKVLGAGDHTPAALVSACEELLGDPSYAKAADGLRAEMAAAPTPWALVGRLEDIAAAGAYA
ncbi:nucleotide disphospho-sugar-binding domain-containing protein [Streptomyces sp. NPDC059002]|uniref:nucleotide disphospho-sugar-binding domain-containing protein n=1 Tax=Streptomyces sp. NPDC059002 TaxID=3346690 RepID=UPI0036817928